MTLVSQTNILPLNYTVFLAIQPEVPLRLPCYDFTPVSTCNFEKLYLIKNNFDKKIFFNTKKSINKQNKS